MTTITVNTLVLACAAQLNTTGVQCSVRTLDQNHAVMTCKGLSIDIVLSGPNGYVTFIEVVNDDPNLPENFTTGINPKDTLIEIALLLDDLVGVSLNINETLDRATTMTEASAVLI